MSLCLCVSVCDVMSAPPQRRDANHCCHACLGGLVRLLRKWSFLVQDVSVQLKSLLTLITIYRALQQADLFCDTLTLTYKDERREIASASLASPSYCGAFLQVSGMRMAFLVLGIINQVMFTVATILRHTGWGKRRMPVAAISYSIVALAFLLAFGKLAIVFYTLVVFPVFDCSSVGALSEPYCAQMQIYLNVTRTFPELGCAGQDVSISTSSTSSIKVPCERVPLSCTAFGLHPPPNLPTQGLSISCFRTFPAEIYVLASTFLLSGAYLIFLSFAYHSKVMAWRHIQQQREGSTQEAAKTTGKPPNYLVGAPERRDVSHNPRSVTLPESRSTDSLGGKRSGTKMSSSLDHNRQAAEIAAEKVIYLGRGYGVLQDVSSFAKLMLTFSSLCIIMWGSGSVDCKNYGTLATGNQVASECLPVRETATLAFGFTISGVLFCGIFISGIIIRATRFMLKRAHWIAFFHYFFSCLGFAGMAMCFFMQSNFAVNYSCGAYGHEEVSAGVLPLMWSGLCAQKMVNLTNFSPSEPPGSFLDCSNYCKTSIPTSSLTLMGIAFLSLVYLCMQLARYQWDARKWLKLRGRKKRA